MIKYLQTVYSNPLEREYEGWVVEGLERYFRRIGQKIIIWALSPKYEKAWPADEVSTIHGKLVGLQFKQAKMAKNNNPEFNRLHWTLGSPSGQYNNIQATKEIYYVLPTFINRHYHREALHHCLFWRPDLTISDTQAWYDNSKATTAHNFLSNDPFAYRWGRFVELIENCDIGRKVQSVENVQEFIRKIYESYPYTIIYFYIIIVS